MLETIAEFKNEWEKAVKGICMCMGGKSLGIQFPKDRHKVE